jgi:hypothetical protein
MLRINLLLDVVALLGVVIPITYFANEVMAMVSLTSLFVVGGIVTVASGLWIIYRLEHLNGLEIKQNV